MRCMGDFGSLLSQRYAKPLPAKNLVGKADISPNRNIVRPMPVIKPAIRPMPKPMPAIQPVARPLPKPMPAIQPIVRPQPAIQPVAKPMPAIKPVLSQSYDKSSDSRLKSAPQPSLTQKAQTILKDIVKPKTSVLQTASPAVAVLSNTSNAVAITSKAAPTTIVPGTVLAPQISQAPKKGNTGMIVGGIAVAGVAAYMFMKD